MAGDKVLVLGGTGPAGICLLRELLFRKHGTIAYARNPSKIPDDLKSNPLLEVRLI
jgi:putative NADH-flavin reductase